MKYFCASMAFLLISHLQNKKPTNGPSNIQTRANQPTNHTTSNVKHISIALLNHIIFRLGNLSSLKNHAADHMDGFGRRCASTRRNSGIHSDPPGRRFPCELFWRGWCWKNGQNDHDSDKRHRRFWGFFCGFYLGDIPWPLNQNKIINIWWYFCPFKCFCPVEKW